MTRVNMLHLLCQALPNLTDQDVDHILQVMEACGMLPPYTLKELIDPKSKEVFLHREPGWDLERVHKCPFCVEFCGRTDCAYAFNEEEREDRDVVEKLNE